MDLAPEIQRLLRDARQRLQEAYGDRLVRVVLYGSQARGEARPDSDVDVLVVLRGSFALYDETRHLVLLALDLFDCYGYNVSFQPFTEADYCNPASSFMRNVQAEGVEL